MKPNTLEDLLTARMNGLLNPDSEDGKALAKARKKTRRWAIIGAGAGATIYIVLTVAFYLACTAATVWVVVLVLQAMGVL
ncbi:MAG: hypothetical protein ACYTFQ_27715 [Planctomycetota bacterium]|jgi:hypothetical protein